MPTEPIPSPTGAGPTDSLYAAVAHATIYAIEAAAYDAWPPLHRGELDGWRLRAGEGVTGRANSIYAMDHAGALALDEKIAAAEAWYAAQGLPPRFQINAAMQPPDLDAALAARDYRLHSPTLVQVAPLARILEQTPTLRTKPHFEIEVAEAYDADWFAAYAASEALDSHSASVRRRILESIEVPVAFTLLRVAEEPVAVGLGVVSAAWMGLFCMSTAPGDEPQTTATPSQRRPRHVHTS